MIVSAKVADMTIYVDLGQKEIAFSFEVVFRSATTHPCLRLVVHGDAESVDRTVRAKGLSSQLHPTYSAVANRQGHARRGMVPDNRKSPFLSNEHTIL